MLLAVTDRPTWGGGGATYQGVSKSFRTKSWRNKQQQQQQQQQTLVEKQHKGLWRQNSLDWLTKQRYNCT
jgi:hypothetical protein